MPRNNKMKWSKISALEVETDRSTDKENKEGNGHQFLGIMGGGRFTAKGVVDSFGQLF